MGLFKTAEQALLNLPGLKTANMLELLGQDTGDEAWNLTTRLVDQLRAGENFSLPCMKGSAQAMTQKINQIIQNAQWLEGDDKQGLIDFQEHLQDLEKQQYPYHSSVTACFIFASLLQLYYDREAGHNGQQDKIELKKWEGSIQKMLADMQAVYKQKESNPKKKIGKFGRDEFIQNWQSNYHTMLDSLFENNAVYWPIFSPLTIDDLNFMHHLPLVPVGFLLKKSEIHDGYTMTCSYFPYHDLDHDISQVRSYLPADPDQKAAKKRKHQQVQGIYHHFCTENPELQLFAGIRLTLFDNLHETGQPIHHLGLPGFLSSDYDYTLRTLSSVQRNFAQGKKYDDLPDKFQAIKNDLNLIRVGFWWCAYYQANQSAGDEVFSIDFTSVNQALDEIEARLIEQIDFCKAANDIIKANIREHLTIAFDACQKSKDGVEALWSAADYRWQGNPRLCFWLALPLPKWKYDGHGGKKVIFVFPSNVTIHRQRSQPLQLKRIN